ncbi:ABC transporter permease [Pedobacter kyonggii]|uniref:Transport permease protein n=1 Tax=Pedobacter kyonggii TaxID=1926871 RepID=A0A4Q9HGC8_9SPHI|nr:ABC transporter permease [Pedobacter kyonggii]TBO44304.1 ABC transporter permease [Pedobacter kyonggii]
MSYIKAKSFIKRDFIIEFSYKLNFILTFITSIFPVISFFFISKLIAGNSSSSLLKYGGDYFSFALIGIAFIRFFQLAVDTFSGSIKRAQMAGCLEAILSSQTDSKTVVLYSSFYSFLSSGLQLIIMFLVGIIFFGFDIHNVNIAGAVFSFVTSLLIFISLGVFSAAGTIIFKQGEPIGWLFGVVSSLISGAMFPVEVMPSWLRFISKAFPTTYALDALRLALLKNASVLVLKNQLCILSIIALILFPLSLKTFEWAVERGKRDGTLMQY